MESPGDAFHLAEQHIKSKASALHQQFECLALLIQQQFKKYMELQKEIQKRKVIAKEVQALSKEEELLLKKVTEIDSRIAKKQEEIAAREQKEEYISQSVALYRKYFGLRIKRTAAGPISFIFTNIDKKHPDHCCVFDIVIEKNREYKVVKCIPELKDITSLVEELNATDDFSTFVISMRNKFCSICKPL